MAEITNEDGSRNWEANILFDNVRRLEQENAELKAENERLKRENVMLLGQLVINDGEDVTVQISKSQFDEYNKFRTTLQEIKEVAEEIIDIYYPDYYDEGFEEDIVTEFAKQVLDLITKAESEG